MGGPCGVTLRLAQRLSSTGARYISLSLPPLISGERGETSNTQRRVQRAPPVNDAHHSYLYTYRYACLLYYMSVSGSASPPSSPSYFLLL